MHCLLYSCKPRSLAKRSTLAQKILTPSNLDLSLVFTNISSSHWDSDVPRYDCSEISMNRALFLLKNGVGHAIASISI